MLHHMQSKPVHAKPYVATGWMDGWMNGWSAALEEELEIGEKIS